MQLTIEIPDELAQKAEAERDQLISLIQRTLRQPTTTKAGLMQEVFEFLARRPSPSEIIAFQPPSQTIERLEQLLDKNRGGTLTADEEAELDTMQSLNHLFALLKVQARRSLS